MKRGTKVLVNASKLQTERDKMFSDNQTKILERLENIESTLLNLSSQLVMKKNYHVEKLLPFKQDSDMDSFLNKTDGQFQMRRDEFEDLLFCNVTKDLKLKRSFEASLLAFIFSREYISSHRWPGPRYSVDLCNEM